MPVGGTSLLTVTVIAGANPPSTGLDVTADLTPIGGAATQPFSGGPTVFSDEATTHPSTTAGAKSLTATISDAQGRSGTATIAITVEPAVILIHDIQGNGSVSPLTAQVVSTTGIVTGVKATGFFIQAPDADADADPGTSEGIFVYTGSPVPAVAAAGALVRVVGTVQEYYSLTEIAGSPSVTLLSPSTPLPAPVLLTAASTDPAGGIEQLEPYEGMRVRVDSLTVVGATGGTGTEASPVSTGVFYGVLTGLARPFREPGVDVSTATVPDLPAETPRFDSNPERLRVDSRALGGQAVDVTTGAIVADLVGPLDYAFGSYTIDPEVAPSVTGSLSATPVPAPGAGQFTVASFNLLHFVDTGDAGFANRLNKASLVVRTMLRMPDIIGVQEVDTLATLQALATKVNADAGEPSLYTAYLVEGNDLDGIDVGLLVKSSVTVSGVTQEGKDATFIDPRDGSIDTLNDRPPLVLRGTIPHPRGGSPCAVTVVVTHLRSLVDVEANTAGGTYARAKRRAGAEFLATLLAGYQAAGERVVSIGDYNAYQFNDGYVDVLGTIRGIPAPSTQVLLPSADLVEPNFANLIDWVMPGERYWYVHAGTAQALDHVLVSSTMKPWVAGVVYARVNVDFPVAFGADPTRPERVSDHDPVVAYFAFPMPRGTGDFDGDKRGDVAVYRPSSGTWFWLQSSTSNEQYAYRGWGVQAQGDVPVVGDFDGDGMVDPTVFRPRDRHVVHPGVARQLHRRGTGSGGASATDTLVPGDYDGDGKTDAAVYRSSTGTWYIRPSSGAPPWNVVFGQAGDEPIAGRLRRRRQARPGGLPAGERHVVLAEVVVQLHAVGLPRLGRAGAGRRPAPGDYDGDGKTDLCVFRPATGTWFILESHAAWTTWNWFGWGERDRHARAGGLRRRRQDGRGGVPAVDGPVVRAAVERRVAVERHVRPGGRHSVDFDSMTHSGPTARHGERAWAPPGRQNAEGGGRGRGDTRRHAVHIIVPGPRRSSVRRA